MRAGQRRRVGAGGAPGARSSQPQPGKAGGERWTLEFRVRTRERGGETEERGDAGGR